MNFLSFNEMYGLTTFTFSSTDAFAHLRRVSAGAAPFSASCPWRVSPWNCVFLCPRNRVDRPSGPEGPALPLGSPHGVVVVASRTPAPFALLRPVHHWHHHYPMYVRRLSRPRCPQLPACHQRGVPGHCPPLHGQQHPPAHRTPPRRCHVLRCHVLRSHVLRCHDHRSNEYLHHCCRAPRRKDLRKSHPPGVPAQTRPQPCPLEHLRRPTPARVPHVIRSQLHHPAIAASPGPAAVPAPAPGGPAPRHPRRP
mmetsp:Transcript_4344/g.12308  ORF Transcript_4344/g.12308 Transcript_4344/m.12308 type:complete len:252 (+) Transcript_4344:1270-2025(+)